MALLFGVEVGVTVFEAPGGGAPFGETVDMRRGPDGGIPLRGAVGGFEGLGREEYEGERPVV